MQARILIVLGCISVMLGCGGDRIEKTAELPSGYAGLPMHAWDPALLREGPVEHLFFGNLFCEDKTGRLSYSKGPGDSEFCRRVVFAIGYGVRDLRKGPGFKFRSTPVFLPSAASWDNNYVETPSVAKRGNTYYLAYSAWPKLPLENKRYQIGVASLDSKNLAADLLNTAVVFKRLRKNPVIPRNNDTGSGFDRENTQEPSLVYRPDLDRFEIYYVGIRARQPLAPDQPLKDIAQLGLGRVCFNNIFNKVPCSRVVTANPVLLNTNMPDVSFYGGKYFLAYSGLNELRSARARFPYGYKKIYLRSSVNGVDWGKPTALLKRSFNSANERDGIHSASVSFGEAGAFTAAYQGWKLIPGADCIKNGRRIMLPDAAGNCQQSALLIVQGQRGR